MKMYKRYVDVIMLNDKQGEIRPLYLRWEDKTYKIEKYELIGPRNSHVGGVGVLYVCEIHGKSRHLYYEKKNRWFVESTQP
ncbi:MAG: hypothetical protein IJ356_08670 [Erysipelotrichaceae bacterium]|nr:hypothetical protein [Erysipelotrichaceae bacterium]